MALSPPLRGRSPSKLASYETLACGLSLPLRNRRREAPRDGRDGFRRKSAPPLTPHLFLLVPEQRPQPLFGMLAVGLAAKLGSGQ